STTTVFEGFAQSQDLESRVTRSVAIGDLNGDGRNDIVTGNLGSPSRAFLNAGAGAFSPGFDATDDSNLSFSIALADLNGDGSPDLVAGNFLTPTRVYL